jgi:hypothetical protein
MGLAPGLWIGSAHHQVTPEETCGWSIPVKSNAQFYKTVKCVIYKWFFCMNEANISGQN